MSVSLEVGHTFAAFFWSNRDKPRETLLKIVVVQAAIEVGYIPDLHADELFICCRKLLVILYPILNIGSYLLYPNSKLVAGAQDYPSSGSIPCHYAVYLGVLYTPGQKLFIP
jgi:hypothetical protein